MDGGGPGGYGGAKVFIAVVVDIVYYSLYIILLYIIYNILIY